MLQPGTRVAYTHNWLVSAGAISLGHRRGTVSAKPAMNNFFYVEWDDERFRLVMVAKSNLIDVKRLHLEAY